MSSHQQQMYKLFNESQDLAADILQYAQKKASNDREEGITDDEVMQVKAALAIAFGSLSNASGTSVHEALDMVMTVYKHTVTERKYD